MSGLLKLVTDIPMPKLTFFGLMLKKPFLLLVAVPTAIVSANIISFQKVAWLLFWLFIFDFITGVYASYLEWKKSDKADKWFFGKGEGFSSVKAKGSGLKALIYIALPYFLLQFQHILSLKNLKYEKFSDSEFGISTACLLVLCLFEGFSIFHENLPKCGFNLWENIKRIFNFAKEVKKEI